MPLTRKQKKIARVAEPRNKITAADFKKLRNSTMAKKVMKKKRGNTTTMKTLVCKKVVAVSKKW